MHKAQDNSAAVLLPTSLQIGRDGGKRSVNCPRIRVHAVSIIPVESVGRVRTELPAKFGELDPWNKDGQRGVIPESFSSYAAGHNGRAPGCVYSGLICGNAVLLDDGLRERENSEQQVEGSQFVLYAPAC